MSKVSKIYVGATFEKLTIIDFSTPVVYRCGTKKKQVRCKCECGEIIVCVATSLTSGHTKSCGCIKNIWKSKAVKIKPELPFYQNIREAWFGMRNRCHPTKGRKNYSGRGISICKEWASFYEFYKWGIENGYRPSLTIERKDNDLGYSPENCKWETTENQNNNTSRTIWIEHNGEKRTMREWAKIKKIKRQTLYCRIVLYGWSIEKAFHTPILTNKTRHEFNGR